MEEALADHGFDRLPFFFLFFFSTFSFATTFGPIQLTEQIHQGDQFVHGIVTSASWVELDPENKRPYTYWKLRVLDSAGNLGPQDGEISIRSPGGEIGGMGHHVMGSATFREQEEVFVNLTDTARPQVKDVVGLMSGKYTVASDPVTGKKTVRSFMGKPVLQTNGEPFSVETLVDIAQRVHRGQSTDSDKKIFVNKQPTHDSETVLDKPSPLREAMKAKALAQLNAEKKPNTNTNLLETQSQPAEKPEQGFGGWFVAAGVLILTLLMVYLLQK